MPVTKRDKAEIETGADLLLYPGKGGIAIWVRRDECTPRAAIRFRKEDVPLEETCCLLASLRVGLDILERSIAQIHGIEPDVFAAMCADALKIIGPRIRASAEVRQGDKTHELEDRGDRQV